jgi:hypothetical protein
MASSVRASQFLTDARTELDNYYREMQDFDKIDPGQIFKRLAAMSARASFIRSKIVRRSQGPDVNNFRTKEIDPFIAEVDRQFKVWSRYLSVVQIDWEMGSKQ